MRRRDSAVGHSRCHRLPRLAAGVGGVEPLLLPAFLLRYAVVATESLPARRWPDMRRVGWPNPGTCAVIGGRRCSATGFSGHVRRPDRQLLVASGRAWPPDGLVRTARRGSLLLARATPPTCPQGPSWLPRPSGHLERRRVRVPSGQARAISRGIRGIVPSLDHLVSAIAVALTALFGLRPVRASMQAVRVEAVVWLYGAHPLRRRPPRSA